MWDRHGAAGRCERVGSCRFRQPCRLDHDPAAWDDGDRHAGAGARAVASSWHPLSNYNTVAGTGLAAGGGANDCTAGVWRISHRQMLPKAKMNINQKIRKPSSGMLRMTPTTTRPSTNAPI